MSMTMFLAGGLAGAVPGVLAVWRVRNLRVAEERILGDGTVLPGAEPEELTDEELAYLSGGPERVGQVALAGLFLDDRIEGTSSGLWLVAGAASAERDSGGGSLRRAVVRLLDAQGVMGVRRLVVTALATDGVVEDTARGLRKRGLCREPADVHRARAVWAPARRRAYIVGGVSAALTVVGGILLAVVASGGLAAFVTGALAAWTVGCLRAGVEASDACVRPSPRTPTGDAAVDAAAESLKEFRYTMGRGLDRDRERQVVLRSVAARGFGGLAGGPHPEGDFPARGQVPDIRLSTRDLGYGLYSQSLEPFVRWCLFSNWRERIDAAEEGEAFVRAPTQDLWDQAGASSPRVVEKGSVGNWRLDRSYPFRDTTVPEGW